MSVFLTILMQILVLFLRPFFVRRLIFERRNLSDPFSRSFKRDGKVANYCFEVSSEGEFQSVSYLIEYYLQNKKLVELIYCSPSVEKSCQKLAKKYDNLRAYRLPLIGLNLLDKSCSVLRWSTAPVVIMVRYDFFPELLWLGKRSHKFILTSATLMNKKSSWITQWIYSHFDLIIFSRESEKIQLEDKFKVDNTDSFDFRVLSIDKRIQNSDKILDEARWPDYFKKGEIPSLVFGSFWPNEVDLINNEIVKMVKESKLRIAVFPHELDSFHLQKIERNLQNKNIPYTLWPNTNLSENPGVVIVTKKGILLEAYTRFNFAFVGGGHHKSIHSVMEPFLAGCHVFCGPRTHRSTEFQQIKDKSATTITRVVEMSDFSNILESSLQNAEKQEDNLAFTNYHKQHFDEILKKIDKGES